MRFFQKAFNRKERRGLRKERKAKIFKLISLVPLRIPLAPLAVNGF
jgi:hypothetical protein